MIEKIYNLFIFIENNIIYELGVAVHEIKGTDSEKLTFLQTHVHTDLKKAIRFLLSDRYLIENVITNETIAALKYDKFRMLTSMNLHMQVFEEIFQYFEASNTPLFCITPVIEGQLKFDAIEKNKLPNKDNLQEVKSIKSNFLDYLTHYTSEEGFDLSRLLNDDYFLAIRLLYNNGHYVSALKLLMSFIDTVAYLEFDDVSKNFQQWLDKYVDLISIEVSSAELWEMRNSLLHMTNYDSRKVLKGEVHRLMFYVGTLKRGLPKKTDEAKYFELMSLIIVISQGVEKWAKTYNVNPSKIAYFVDRYDRIISDSRYQTIEIE